MPFPDDPQKKFEPHISKLLDTFAKTGEDLKKSVADGSLDLKAEFAELQNQSAEPVKPVKPKLSWMGRWLKHVLGTAFTDLSVSVAKWIICIVIVIILGWIARLIMFWR